MYGISYPGACHQVSSPPTGGQMGLRGTWWRPNRAPTQWDSTRRAPFCFIAACRVSLRVFQEAAPERSLPGWSSACLFNHVKGMWTGFSLTNALDPGAHLLKCIVQLVCLAWGRPSAAQQGSGAERDNLTLLQVLFLPNQQHSHSKIISNNSTSFWSKMDRREAEYFKANEQPEDGQLQRAAMQGQSKVWVEDLRTGLREDFCPAPLSVKWETNPGWIEGFSYCDSLCVKEWGRRHRAPRRRLRSLSSSNCWVDWVHKRLS